MGYLGTLGDLLLAIEIANKEVAWQNYFLEVILPT